MKTNGRTITASALLAGAVAAMGATGIAGGALKASSETVTLGDNAPGSATATCQQGSKAVSGGFDAPGFTSVQSGPFILPLASARSGKRTWTTGANNFNDEGDLVGYAYCADSLPKAKAKAVTTTIGPLEAGVARAKCANGGEAISGGFVAADELADDELFPFMSRRNGKRTWTVRAFNDESNEELDLTSVAYCVKDKIGLRRDVGEIFFTGDQEIVSATAKCPKKTKALSGGFTGFTSEDEDFETFPFESRRLGGRRWTGSAAMFLENADSGMRWEVYAYCIKKGAL